MTTPGFSVMGELVCIATLHSEAVSVMSELACTATLSPRLVNPVKSEHGM